MGEPYNSKVIPLFPPENKPTTESCSIPNGPDPDNCDLKLDVALTSFSKKKPGNSYACVYRKKSVMFTFPQWKGKECYPINYSTCMVNTATLDPALYGK